MQTLTTTIKRRWLKEIIAGTKKTEYREVKLYWVERLANFVTPFKMRMINGMSKTAPEVTVLINKVDVDSYPEFSDAPVYRLHIAKVLSFKNWDKKHGVPA